MNDCNDIDEREHIICCLTVCNDETNVETIEMNFPLLIECINAIPHFKARPAPTFLPQFRNRKLKYFSSLESLPLKEETA